MGKRTTHHAKNGRFTSFNRANTVTQDGERFRMVRTLEPIEPKDVPDPATAESIVQVKQKVASFANRIAPQWIALDEVVKS